MQQLSWGKEVNTVKIRLNVCILGINLLKVSLAYSQLFLYHYVQVTYLVLPHHRGKSKPKQCLLKTFGFALSCSFNFFVIGKLCPNLSWEPTTSQFIFDITAIFLPVQFNVHSYWSFKVISWQAGVWDIYANCKEKEKLWVQRKHKINALLIKNGLKSNLCAFKIIESSCYRGNRVNPKCFDLFLLNQCTLSPWLVTIKL